MNLLAQAIASGIGRVVGGWRPATGSQAMLALEQVLPLDARRRLCVVRCGTQRLLLLTGGPQDLALGWISGQEAREGALPLDPTGAVRPQTPS